MPGMRSYEVGEMAPVGLRVWAQNRQASPEQSPLCREHETAAFVAVR